MSAKESPGARRRREKEREKQDSALFDHLAQVHRLSEEDQDLLTAIAAEREFSRRSDMFVRPSLIERTPDPDRWSPAQVRRVAETLAGPVRHPTGDAGGRVVR